MLTQTRASGDHNLSECHEQIAARYRDFAGRGLNLDITRGKPGPEQLDLSMDLLHLGKDDYRAEDGADCRNYLGGVHGLPEARRLFAPMLGAPPEQVLVAGNSSLALMHDALTFAFIHGVPGGDRAWSAGYGSEPAAFLCPSPGYDRHFGLCEGLDIRMVPVPLTGAGPDMDVVERLVANPAVKGMWCVPQYSNPTGETYSDAVVERLAAMPTGAGDFRLFWDNAYALHDLTDRPQRVANILECCSRAGAPDRALVFSSTSKVTFAGAGLALFAGSKVNLDWFAGHLGRRTIGPDKLNQLRHLRLLKDQNGLAAHMARQRTLLQPKFEAVLETFDTLLAGTGAASWTRPEGGYFISVNLERGSAARAAVLAAEAGVKVTPAGATYPYGQDQADRNLRVAPTFPSVELVRLAAEGLALSILLADAEAALDGQRAAA